MDHPLFDKLGFLLTVMVLIGSFLMFGTLSDAWAGSLFAAIMAAGLFWISYIIVRWVVLAIRK